MLFNKTSESDVEHDAFFYIFIPAWIRKSLIPSHFSVPKCICKRCVRNCESEPGSPEKWVEPLILEQDFQASSAL